MRLLWVEKNTVKLFFRLNLIAPIPRLSNEILCIVVAQGTAKLPTVKVGGLIKILLLSPIHTTRVWPGSGSFFFVSPNLTTIILAASWASRMHSTSFESPKQGAIRFTLKKSVIALFRHFISTQHNSISITLKLSKRAILTPVAVSRLSN